MWLNSAILSRALIYIPLSARNHGSFSAGVRSLFWNLSTSSSAIFPPYSASKLISFLRLRIITAPSRYTWSLYMPPEPSVLVSPRFTRRQDRNLPTSNRFVQTSAWDSRCISRGPETAPQKRDGWPCRRRSSPGRRGTGSASPPGPVPIGPLATRRGIQRGRAG